MFDKLVNFIDTHAFDAFNKFFNWIGFGSIGTSFSVVAAQTTENIPEELWDMSDTALLVSILVGIAVIAEKIIVNYIRLKYRKDKDEP